VRLEDLSVLLVDCQTTHPAADRGRVLELAWCRTCACSGIPQEDQVAAHVLQQPQHDDPVSASVLRITGITPEEIEEGDDPAVVAQLLASRILVSGSVGPEPVLIAHYARFERQFLLPFLEAHEAAPQSPLQFICTHEIARRLLPELPRRGLRALAGYFGFPMDGLKRSGPNVRATAAIWIGLLDMLAAEGIATLCDLESFLETPPPRRKRKWQVPMDREKRLSLPDSPGIYRFIGGSGEILYIGKATSLRSRVNSYFRTRRSDEKVLELVSQARDIEAIPTETPLEAAILEMEQIRGNDPPYNTALRNRGRKTWFFSLDLQDCSIDPHPGLPVGPLPSEDSAVPLLLVRELLSRQEHTEEDLQRFCESLLLDEARLAIETLSKGLNDLRQLHFGGEAPTEVSALLAAGARIWEERISERELRREEEEITEEEEEGLDIKRAEDEPVTPEKVLRYAEGAVAWTSTLIRRARWFRILSSSTITWEPVRRDCSTERCLVLRDGSIVRCQDLTSSQELPGTATHPSRKSAFLDREKYERLRLITTELRRLVGEEAGPVVHLPTGRSIRGDALVRLLRMV
jgi:DNA polymerase-3 subunit epsilon